jgi:hydroxyacylglutathione hydrolase
MIFKPYYYFETGCAAYVFGCAGLGACAVVDPHLSTTSMPISRLRRLQGACASRTSSTRTSTPTIAPAGPALARQGRALTYGLHESAEVDFAFEPLRDGQELELGNTCA